MAVEVIKFQLPNCGPCKLVQVTLDKLQAQFPQVQFSVEDASAGEGRGKAISLGINKAPTVLVFRDGTEMARFEGAKFRLADYETAVQAALTESKP
jgi:thiol-disulfide isomerase/thioredoxin